MRIAICIITFNRPDGLRAALEGLAAQQLGDAPPKVSVIVVDNDPHAAGRSVCDALRPAFPFKLIYGVEPTRGIPFARNRCVQLARPDHDWIGFIDDDEVPAANWLATLLRVQRNLGADVVTGPVVPLNEGEFPAWARKGRFFERLRYGTGTRRDRAFTNNVLFRAEIFDRLTTHFDQRMAMTGGSDAHFTQRVHRAGFSIVWVDEAEVFERFPASRVTPAWVYQRAYRIGTTTAFIHRDLRGLPYAAAVVLPIAAYRILKGTLQAAVGLILGRHHRVAGIRQVAYAAGMLIGLTGGRYHEYNRTHGT